MPFNPTEQEKINLAWQSFLMKRRPPVEIRSQVDLDMKIDGYSIEIFTIRPRWDKPDEIIHSPIAKTTFVKSKNYWKLFWMRANLKWYPYDIKPAVKTFEDFLREVDNDTHACFWG